MTSNKMKKVKTGVFFDGSNMLWGSKESGIKIDFNKLKKYIKKHYSPTIFNYYACEDNNPTTERYKIQSEKQKKFYRKLEGMGYKVIRKDLKHFGDGQTKCDMDVEITMDIRNYENDIDCIILFSGDSDFIKVVEHYFDAGKHIRIFSFKELISWELKTFAINNPRCSYRLLNEIRDQIERT